MFGSLLNFVLARNINAIFCILAFSLLPPPFSLFSFICLSVLILQKGVQNSLGVVIAYIGVASLILAFVESSDNAYIAYFLIPFAITSFIASSALKASKDWNAALIFLVISVSIIVFIGNTLINWGEIADIINLAQAKQLASDGVTVAKGSSVGDIGVKSTKQITDVISGTMLSALYGMLIFLSALLILVVARYWQSKVFAIISFHKEMIGFRLNIIFAISLMIFATVCFLLEGFESVIYVPLMTLLFSGILLAHFVFSKYKVGKVWVFAFYLIVFLSKIWLLVAAIAVFDSFFDLRKYVGQKNIN
jgi:hypothetical protein